MIIVQFGFCYFRMGWGGRIWGERCFFCEEPSDETSKGTARPLFEQVKTQNPKTPKTQNPNPQNPNPKTPKTLKHPKTPKTPKPPNPWRVQGSGLQGFSYRTPCFMSAP